VTDRLSWLTLAAAVAVALAGASRHVGGWNDGSRLASVECLVDQGTWVIDGSTFAQGPNGTLDKLRINGHYYSDKSPVPAVLMAGVYALARRCGLPSAAERPEPICWLLTVVTAGLAYVVAVVCIDTLARRARLATPTRLTVVGGFALATLALPYSRSVSNHELLLGVVASLLVCFDRIADGHRSRRLIAVTGLLTGLAYAIDLGAGPAVALGAAALGTYRLRRWPAIAWYLAAAAPFGVLHHALNYHIGGGFGPANANAAYFDWPGCPFTASTLTGAWNHDSVGSFLLYAVDLLVGKKGFFGHNLALLLAIPAAWRLLRRPLPRRPEVLTCVGWMLLTWLLYAATSRNYSGACICVRWFVPLVAPGFFILIQDVRQRGLNPSLLCLAAGGAVINVLAWRAGPWSGRMVPGYWLLVGSSLIGWWWFCGKRRPHQQRPLLSLARPAHAGRAA
jgi:hypothetical protein